MSPIPPALIESLPGARGHSCTLRTGSGRDVQAAAACDRMARSPAQLMELPAWLHCTFQGIRYSLGSLAVKKVTKIG